MLIAKSLKELKTISSLCNFWDFVVMVEKSKRCLSVKDTVLLIGLGSVGLSIGSEDTT